MMLKILFIANSTLKIVNSSFYLVIILRERKNSRHSLLSKLHSRTIKLQRSKSFFFILLNFLSLLLISFLNTRVNHSSFRNFFLVNSLIRDLT